MNYTEFFFNNKKEEEILKIPKEFLLNYIINNSDHVNIDGKVNRIVFDKIDTLTENFR